MPENPEADDSVQHVNVMGEETQNWLQCDIINVAPTNTWLLAGTVKPVNESSIESTSEEKNLVEMWCDMWSSAGLWTIQTKMSNEFQQTASKHPGCLYRKRDI